MSKQLLVVSGGGFPGDTNGSEFALDTALLAYESVFDRITYLSFGDPISVASCEKHPSVEFIRVPVHVRSARLRFLLSFGHWEPGIVHQFKDKKVIADVGKVIRSFIAGGGKFVIIEHLIAAYFLRAFASDLRHCKIAFHAHDVLTYAFSRLARGYRGIARLAWMLEVRKIKRFEHWALKSADVVWSITRADSRQFKKLYGINAESIGVGIDTTRLSSVSRGCNSTVLHLGGGDTRKMHGLQWLVKNVWPRVRRISRDARLLLAGRGSDDLSDPDNGVLGLGYVTDEVAFLSQGGLFVNPQMAGSGIKIKSLNAMAAGKTLVSTTNGLSGIVGTNGMHFLRADGPQKFSEAIVHCIKDEAYSKRLGEAAVKFVTDKYSLSAVVSNSVPQVQAFASGFKI